MENSQLRDFCNSIKNIGIISDELKIKSKKIIYDLKKNREELIQEMYDEAFNIEDADAEVNTEVNIEVNTEVNIETKNITQE